MIGALNQSGGYSKTDRKLEKKNHQKIIDFQRRFPKKGICLEYYNFARKVIRTL